MYQQFFNFNTAPFSIAPDPRFIYMSEHHQEGLAHLMYGILQGNGFIALTGEVGTGKTTLLHCLLQQLPDNIELALVLNPKLNSIELLATICDELHIAYDQDNQTLKGLVDKLNKHLLAAHASNKRTVLLIDEAQNLSLDVLEQIRLLTNLETTTTKLLQIILIGQPELKQLLDRPELRQLNQRITARYHLTPLSYSDTQRYIKHRLKISGGNPTIFNQPAIKKVYTLSKGIPRLINILCDRALLGAYVSGDRYVSAKIITKAAKEVFNSTTPSAKIGSKFALSASLLVIMLTCTSYYVAPKQPTPIPKPVVITEPVKKPVFKKLNFKTAIEKKNLSMNGAILQLAKIWDKSIANTIDCKEIKTTGIYCLFGKSSWNNLKALNRPVIMEFTRPKSEKVYALLVGLEKHDKPVFYIDKKTSFPLEQVLNHWNGYYLMLWEPPISAVTTVSPKTSSAAVLWIRNHLATHKKGTTTKSNSTYFDNSLKKVVVKFQKNKHLIPDGIVGPKTFIHLKNTDPLDTSPKLKLVN